MGPPVFRPQNWPAPNYIDPERRTWMPAFAMTWQIASTLLVWGRLYLRSRKLAGPFGYDDAFMLFAWMTSVAFTAFAWIITSQYGVDRHTWDVPPHLLSGAGMMSWILQVLMLISSGATKASVLLFYRRLVVNSLARRWKLAIYFALIFHALYLLGMILSYTLICHPIEAYWMAYDPTYEAEYTCAPGALAFSPTLGSLSVLSDLYAVALPFFILRHYALDIPRRQKIGLNIIFATGLFVAGAGMARTYYLTQISKTPDVSWAGFNICVWTIIELQLGIICACAPCLRTFYRCYFSESFLWLSYASRNKGSDYTDGSHTTGGQPDLKQQPASKEKHVEIDMQALTRASSEDVEARESSNAAAGPFIGAADSYQPRSTSEGGCRAEPVGASFA